MNALFSTMRAGRSLNGTGLEGGKALGLALLDSLRRAGVRIDAHAGAGRAAEQFINGHAERLALDVPKRLVHAADGAGEDRPAAIERVPIHRLPVMRDRARVFADQIRREFLDGRGDGLRAAFDDRFAQSDDAGVGVDLQEEPARFDEEGFDLGDLELVADADHRLGVLAAQLAFVIFELFQVVVAGIQFRRRFGGGELEGCSGGSSGGGDGFAQERAAVKRCAWECAGRFHSRYLTAMVGRHSQGTEAE